MAELFSIEAERALLGCILEEGRKLLVAQRELHAVDFYDPKHRVIFEALTQLASANDEIDSTRLVGFLSRGKKLEEAGGPAYVHDLEIAAPYWTEGAPYIADVREMADRRALVALARSIAVMAGDLARPLATTRADALRGLHKGIAGPSLRTLSDVIDDAVSHIQKVEEGTAPPIAPTGFDALDAIIGGWQSTLTVVGARTGVGKSAFVASAIQLAAASGMKVGVFSLEDAAEWLAWRYMAYATGVNQFALRYLKKTDDQWCRIGDGFGATRAWSGRVLLDDRPGLNSTQLCMAADDMVVNHGVQIIFVDHLKEMNHGHHRRERHDLNMEASLQEMRAMQKRHDIPLVIAHQMNEEKDAKPDAVPSLWDFSDGKVVGKMARVALALSRAPESDVMKITVLKQTNGFANKACDVEFVNAAAMVRNIEKKAQQGQLLQLTGGDD